MDLISVYRSLPGGLQSAALTFFGFQQYRIRYQQSLPQPYDRADLHEPVPAPELKRWQQQRFSALVAHAATYVPYYRDFFRRNGIAASELTIDNFTSVIPVLGKSEIIADPLRFHSEYYGKKAISLFTSGTSGSPMPIKCTVESRAINYAFYRSLLRKHGCDVRDRSAVFAGRLVVGANEKSNFARKDFFTNTMYLSSYHITEENIPAYLQALRKWNPRYIDSYPSAIYLLADYVNRHGTDHGLKLKFVLTSSETLTDVQRESIARAFGCKVIDHYGCTEMAVSASSERPGDYQVDSLYSLVEFLPSDSGNGSALVCTGLLNFAMPLIRYSIGDVVSGVSVSAAEPFCNPRFAQIVGREDDVIVTSDGRKIGRMDPAFKGMSGIKLAQIIQTALTEIEVLVVPADDLNKEQMERQLVANIRERTNADMQVRIRLVDEIPLTKAGKFKSVVSRLPR
jgi:phenylacetate-CoA ligase